MSPPPQGSFPSFLARSAAAGAPPIPRFLLCSIELLPSLVRSFVRPASTGAGLQSYKNVGLGARVVIGRRKLCFPILTASFFFCRTLNGSDVQCGAVRPLGCLRFSKWPLQRQFLKLCLGLSFENWSCLTDGACRVSTVEYRGLPVKSGNCQRMMLCVHLCSMDRQVCYDGFCFRNLILEGLLVSLVFCTVAHSIQGVEASAEFYGLCAEGVAGLCTVTKSVLPNRVFSVPASVSLVFYVARAGSFDLTFCCMYYFRQRSPSGISFVVTGHKTRFSKSGN